MTPSRRPLLATTLLVLLTAGCGSPDDTTATTATAPSICGKAPDLAGTQAESGGYALTELTLRPQSDAAPPTVTVGLTSTRTASANGSGYQVYVVRDGLVVAAGPMDPTAKDGALAVPAPRVLELTAGKVQHDIVREPLALCAGQAWPDLYAQHGQVEVVLRTRIPAQIPAPSPAYPLDGDLVTRAPFPAAPAA
ncbi:hypothetical protein F4553_002256 [Allocatelliglobosispora scoriae]|uniref:DUF4232 domain-containing protein n=1 Tax=Allocatelliglobosispora scoriae TaxID=643052 RepID=A0A841BIC8_9ACTN|nr:hypothetical protein [Allocatelliglobosispora scoriae]MBB5868877.1 hypothetical protein [Allocatelliglobosispora scoriae]